MGDKDMHSVGNPKGEITNLSEARLWKALEGINTKLSDMGNQLAEVVRLEERIRSHSHALSRYGSRLDEHDVRLRDTEMWQAHHGDKSSVERLITNVQDEVDTVRTDIDDIKKTRDTNKGRDDTVKTILKWVAGIFAAIIVWLTTKGP